jgi:hypothetical protein
VGELTERRLLCGSGAHRRSLGLPNFLLVLVALVRFMRFSPTENRTRGCVSKLRGRNPGRDDKWRVVTFIRGREIGWTEK